MGAAVGAIAAAGAARRAESDLLERFRVSDATAPDRAQTLNKLGLEGSRYLDRFQTAGVIRQSPGAGGRYYLDEIAFAAYRRRQNPARAAVLLALGVLMLALGVAIAISQRPPHP